MGLLGESSARLFLLLGLLALALAAPCSAQPGPVTCWGNYARESHSPLTGNDYIAVSAGGYHGLALTAGGKIVTWGENIRGQCNAPLGGGFTALAAGLYHNVALRSDGSIVAWGDDSRGQCDMPKNRRFRAIAAGSWHSLAIGSDGSLAAWGWNDQGQCNVPPGNDYVSIAAGVTHSLALRTDGSLIAWGSNSDGQCAVPPGNDFLKIAAGSLHNVALRSDGTLVAWGRQYESQCRVPAGNDFVAVAAGCMHSLALTRDGNLVAWGHDDNAQCDVSSNERFSTIAAGGSHSLAIRGSPVTPAGALLVKAVAQQRGARTDDAPAKPAVSPEPASAPLSPTAQTDAGADSLSGPGRDTAALLPRQEPLAQPTGASDTLSARQDIPADHTAAPVPSPRPETPATAPSGTGGGSPAPAAHKDNPAERITAPVPLLQAQAPAGPERGTVSNSLGSSHTVKPTGSAQQQANVQPAGSAAPLVLKHTTADHTVASVPPSGLKTAAPEPRVASLIGSPNAGTLAALPRPESKTQPATGRGTPGALQDAPGKPVDALAPQAQGQPAAAPAVDNKLTAKAQALYDSLFAQDRLPGVLSWAGRPIDLIALGVFATCILSIIALLFRR